MSDGAQMPVGQLTISPQMTVREILAVLPDAELIMSQYGLHCFSCGLAGTESLEEGCRIHGFDEDTTQALVEDLNDALAEAPDRPQELTITKEASQAFVQVAKDQGYEGQDLLVTFDMHGAFCLEFVEKPDPLLIPFVTDASITVFASPLVLKRIGGATIDMREGRFKLDLPEDTPLEECRCTPETCGCQQGTISA